MDVKQIIVKEDKYSIAPKFEYTAAINACLKDLRRDALRGTGTEPFVLILGEIGVGKEDLARLICQGSRRSKKPWLILNCALTEDEVTLEKELYGEETLSFNQKCILNGLFDLARGGTVFLEKIDRLSPSMQNKLAQVIESGKYRRIGGNEELTFDVRLISETDQKLNTFSASFIKALSKITLEIPPLRTHTEAILPMAIHYAELHFKYQGKLFQGFTTETEKALKSYPWPGNTHELICLIKRSALLSHSNSTVTLEPFNSAPVTISSNSNVNFHSENGYPEKIHNFTQLKKQWCDAFEKNYLTTTLTRHKGNVSSASREAKLDRSNFLRLMRRHNLKASDYRRREQETDIQPLNKAA